MIFDKTQELVVRDEMLQSRAGRQEILACCEEALKELKAHPTIRMFACDEENDILLLMAALHEIDRLHGARK